MLNGIFEKLLSPIGISKTNTKPASKHLIIQTVYSGAGNNKNKEPTPIPAEVLLSKQKEILLNQDQTKFLTIEQVTLNGSTVLVGLTRHAHTIYHGIFMFPSLIKYTNEWDTMKKQACCLNAGLAAFQPLHEVTCLKLNNPDDAECCSYLIDHRALSRVKWLWHSSCE